MPTAEMTVCPAVHSKQLVTSHYNTHCWRHFHCKIHHSIQKPTWLPLCWKLNALLGSLLLLVGLWYIMMVEMGGKCMWNGRWRGTDSMAIPW